ncbi:spermidine/putrescine ABC transporter permease PotC [Halarcobacter ebronensis]|uniref:Spermidine/putrescine transport system permease protein PotC n=1 Tax=Halarcobacter ebronensis TaxID=1462615 RepID=A0A4V1M0D3_9BACT|nr:spermidine/putrescine ABC transporter permease PotC [Halarcobacter ebronensis]QKF81302.1 iron(III)/spermidine/putrescine ABC transporter, permease protein [Halarcobacter ebronensis]RXK04867.1 spermidine/putrescine ABC transporter permease PotC [Halarcobacter ebronensis]
MRKFYASFIYTLLYLPIAVLIVYSFNASKYTIGWKGFSFMWYEKLLEHGSLLDAAWHSVSVAFSSAVLATTLGTLGALALFRYDFFGKKIFNTLVYVLIMSPEIVMGISLLMLFVFISLPLGFTTLLIAHITFCMPFVIVTVLARLNGFDKNIIEAAKDLGASEFKTFVNIILPNIIPAIVAGFLLSLTLSFDDVIISFFVTGPDYEILPLKIYSMVKLGVKPEINALCTIMFVFTLVMVLFSQFLIKEKK